MKRAAYPLSALKASKVAHLNKEVIEELENPSRKKKPKYNNSKTQVDGIEFDSEKEAKRYKELRLMLKVGEIGLLRMQVEYELNPGGTHSLKYVADFVYLDSLTGQEIVEDVKGFRTREYKKKRHLMKKVHRIEIQEI